MNEIITWAIVFAISTIGVSFVWEAIQKALSSDNSITVTTAKSQKDRLEQFEKAGIDPNDYTLDDNEESSGENKSLSFVGSVKKHLENNAITTSGDDEKEEDDNEESDDGGEDD